ncbi:hypothetical protein KUTeg_010145 [Tegillarca granosa]|uniref:SRCR domain-containing protein n=1 Tax=Tegillarca granosa TaxID=220873 RepID=A0ABQ9F5X4_TEGGR|nr:hypothetical protein KUTeg_010145 [Tegillarca granosa]
MVLVELLTDDQAYGPGKENILLDDVQCEGIEPSIANCVHGEWSVTDCTQDEIVGVTCFQVFIFNYTFVPSLPKVKITSNITDLLFSCQGNGENGRIASKPCGVQTRSRECNNPEPKHEGLNCSGRYIEERECFTGQACPVDGKWSDWSYWTDCSETCGNGTHTRNRECNSPEPENGGLNCSGIEVENEVCYSGVGCPVLNVTVVHRPEVDSVVISMEETVQGRRLK